LPIRRSHARVSDLIWVSVSFAAIRLPMWKATD
jgi:hypothetical protein